MLYYSEEFESGTVSEEKLKQAVSTIAQKIGPKKRILIIPPDLTRFHSMAGKITEFIWDYYGSSIKAVMPALGTHFPMNRDEIKKMFGPVPYSLFVNHDWRNDIETLGEMPGSFIERLSEGKLSCSWKVQVNRLIRKGGFDCILSVGQVVPHEVIGMANYTKNIIVGTGGKESIDKSHFLGAVHGIEKILGRTDTPVRKAVDTAFDTFLGDLPFVFIQTVIGTGPDVKPELSGIFAGEDRECFEKAAELSARKNITLLDDPPGTVVVYLNPEEFRSTWLGNKSIYRTRLLIRDGGHLIVLAPGVHTFGEDGGIDTLIRKYGYCGTEKILEYAQTREDLGESLAAAAHLIHGSTEGRFTVTYCPGGLSRDQVESVGYRYGNINEMTEKYMPGQLREGFYPIPGGGAENHYYFIAHPALGLWASRDKLKG